MSTMKPAIVCDNYKVKRFREALAAAGIENVKEFPFTPDTTTLAFEIPVERLQEITKLCKEVELGFKRQN